MAETEATETATSAAEERLRTAIVWALIRNDARRAGAALYLRITTHAIMEALRDPALADAVQAFGQEGVWERVPRDAAEQPAPFSAEDASR